MMTDEDLAGFVEMVCVTTDIVHDGLRLKAQVSGMDVDDFLQGITVGMLQCVIYNIIAARRGGLNTAMFDAPDKFALWCSAIFKQCEEEIAQDAATIQASVEAARKNMRPTKKILN